MTDAAENAIIGYAEAHSTYNLPDDLVTHQAAMSAAEADVAQMDVDAWRNPAPDEMLPDGVELYEAIDDGTASDVSQVRYYRAPGYAIYSYNNNAWGHCDVLSAADDPCSIAGWLAQWDELPETWLEEYLD